MTHAKTLVSLVITSDCSHCYDTAIRHVYTVNFAVIIASFFFSISIHENFLPTFS